MLLQLKNVSKRYGSPDGAQAFEVLKGVNLNIDAGQSVAIVGPSGSGKSALLNIIGTLDRPTDGEVILDGQEVRQLDEKEVAALRNRKIGFVFQLHHLLPQCTVLENVLIPTLATPSDSGAARERAEGLLDRVGLKERMFHRPGQLSGGERQRVAVVRALINQPKLLLADEPTGSLDHASAENLAQLLVELNREEGVALIVVTHSLDLAGRMSKRFELRDGALVEA